MKKMKIIKTKMKINKLIMKIITSLFCISILVLFFGSCGPDKKSSSNNPAATLILYSAGVSTGTNLGGRSGLDAICVNNKPSAVKAENIRAFICINATDDISTMPPNYGIPTTVPITSVNGTVVDFNFSSLLSGSIPITLENAGVITNSTNWLSGCDTTGTGVASGSTCSGWTSTTGNAASGSPTATNSNWLGIAFVSSCGTALERNVLCIGF
jgi:hypothetical protein